MITLKCTHDRTEGKSCSLTTERLLQHTCVTSKHHLVIFGSKFCFQFFFLPTCQQVRADSFVEYGGIHILLNVVPLLHLPPVGPRTTAQPPGVRPPEPCRVRTGCCRAPARQESGQLSQHSSAARRGVDSFEFVSALAWKRMI